MNHPHANDKLQALFEEKLTALKRYLAITGKMETMTANSDLQQLRSLLFDRQKYMRKIETVDKSIDAVVQSRKKLSGMISNNSKRLFDRYRQDFLGVLEAVPPMDEKIFFLLEKESEKTKTKLLAIKKNKQAVSRYGSQDVPVSRYLDTKK